jgi:hypothetical protein
MPLKGSHNGREQVLACSSFGGIASKVQPASNTSFEFDLIDLFYLDKTSISKHPASRLASLKIIRFGFDRFALGLGHEIGHGTTRLDSFVGRGGRESCSGSYC